ncbi:DUF3977 family protein [Bacillus carboniphilus]|uniref:DUF3977 family protein n=1 Tax=Bacillus carboniphilus TaxID=86663 RepID=A0ABY9JSG0_9BACI|nr:DUF3977 family protein [Bacillus carboniphilus]WLR42337.1 DUF3977 family protein [Bacillus carboniphilus]
MKYIEIGVGNKWFVRTEIEREDGTEYERKGVVGPIRFRSFYVRVWFGDKVIVFDSLEGIKRIKKERKGLKFLVGVVSE